MIEAILIIVIIVLIVNIFILVIHYLKYLETLKEEKEFNREYTLQAEIESLDKQLDNKEEYVHYLRELLSGYSIKHVDEYTWWKDNKKEKESNY